MKCPNCEKNVGRNDDVCKNCGYEIGYMRKHTHKSIVVGTNGVESSKKATSLGSQTQRPTVRPTTKTNTSKTTGQKQGKKTGVGVLVTLGILFSVVFPRIGGLIDDITNSFDESSSYEETTYVDDGYTEDITYLDQDAVLEDIDIYYYDYVNSLGTVYVLFEIHNNSEYHLNASVELELLDESGTPIDMKYGSIQAFEQGTYVMVPFLMDDAVDWNIYMTVEESIYYEMVDSNLEVITRTREDEEVVTVKNTGDIDAEFVEVKILFFNGDEVVNYMSQYFTDDDYELKAGKAITDKLKPYVEYDSVAVYVHGSRYIEQ